MLSAKLTGHSRVLRRDFHCDLFRSEAEPERLIAFFGGSGRDRAEYEARQQSLVPVFNTVLKALEDEGHRFAFTYVTAPYDVPITALGHDEASSSAWQDHVEDELLPLLPEAPVFFAGYSGGFALGTHGFAELLQSAGGGGIGADQVSASLTRPQRWREPLLLLYNTQDPVRGPNREALDALEGSGVVSVEATRPGRHGLQDYLANGSVERLLRFALAD